jgi:N-methylhydantoinase A
VTDDGNTRFVVGIDIGGTFTDCVVLDQAGQLSQSKAFSTPPDFSTGILDALGVAAEERGIELRSLLSRTAIFLHSATVAENAINDGELVPAGFITTWGHEDTLFATRGGFGRWGNLTDDERRNPIVTTKPPPVIPRALTLGVHERVDSRGNVLRSIDEAELERAVEKLKGAEVESLGVSFLWSFANPTNERAAREVIERVWPGVFLTLSHEIAPVLGEYERSSTVALNARLGPVVQDYLGSLQQALQDQGFVGKLLVMQAYGGLLPIEVAHDRPVGMIESGPVSGLVASSRQARDMNISNVLAADMGGTTFKVGVVREGLIEYQRESMVFRYHYSMPKMDVVSLGIAGGSVVSVDPRTGVPQIGPRSAGSYPGPICYDHGGDEPTITDVDAILGYLKPEYFAGGRAKLNLERASEVFADRVAQPLGMSIVEAASSIYRLTNNIIFDLLHKATVQKGLDPRKFALFSFGGTAGMHVASYGAQLGVDRIVIPHSASVQGAFGLVISDIVHEEQTTRPMRMPVKPETVAGLFDDLESRLLEQFREDGFAPEDVSISRTVDMSYRQQTHVLTVPFGERGGPITDHSLADLADLFESMYRQKYGAEAGYAKAGIEFVCFRARGSVPPSHHSVTERELGGRDCSAAVIEERVVWVDEAQELQEVPGIDFDRLQAGNVVSGPAVIWSPITTVVVGRSQVAEVDAHHNLVLTAPERDSEGARR